MAAKAVGHQGQKRLAMGLLMERQAAVGINDESGPGAPI